MLPLSLPWQLFLREQDDLIPQSSNDRHLIYSVAKFWGVWTAGLPNKSGGYKSSFGKLCILNEHKFPDHAYKVRVLEQVNQVFRVIDSHNSPLSRFSAHILVSSTSKSSKRSAPRSPAGFSYRHHLAVFRLLNNSCQSHAELLVCICIPGHRIHAPWGVSAGKVASLRNLLGCFTWLRAAIVILVWGPMLRICGIVNVCPQSDIQ